MGALASNACHSATATAPAPTSLATTKVPATADLSGVRLVDVRVEAPDVAGHLDLSRPDGKVVYTVLVVAGRPLAARVVMPTKDARLTATLHSLGRADKSLSLVIVGGLARGSFQ